MLTLFPLLSSIALAQAPQVYNVELPDEVAALDRTQMPGPLPRRDFQLPTLQSANLSNGIEVLLAEDHDQPLVRVRVVLEAGSFTDPEGLEGLAATTFDMLNEGAGGLDALVLSTELKKLATSLNSSASRDGAYVSIDSLTRNLAPSLDLMTKVLLSPDFPDAEWERIRKQRIQDVKAARTDPGSIARRTLSRTLFGSDYAGRFATEDSYLAISVEDMQAWAGEHIVPGNARILVSGDTTLEAVLPLLEERLGAWSGEGSTASPTPEIHQPEETVIYAVDKPGAAQSVIRMGRFVGSKKDADYTDLQMGNHAFGGMFMARLNMNLREDKGYTYGARSSLSHDYSGSRWVLGTSVKTDVTGASIQEILGELNAIGGGEPVAQHCRFFQRLTNKCPPPIQPAAERPIDKEEADYAKSNAIRGYPARFEQPDYLLNQTSMMLRYSLPKDWLESYIDRVDAVIAENAQSVFAEKVATKSWAIVVVGDLETIQDQLQESGFPVVQLDVDGNRLPEE
ncbi:MAG: pitrilysin family protein [Myxococcota bacterium]|nr:pitrilysin family protein [Myxococcota bacterium]